MPVEKQIAPISSVLNPDKPERKVHVPMVKAVLGSLIFGTLLVGGIGIMVALSTVFITTVLGVLAFLKSIPLISNIIGKFGAYFYTVLFAYYC